MDNQDPNEARWQGKVDAKLDMITNKLNGIVNWQIAHEALDVKRFTSLEVMVEQEKQQKAQITQLMHTVVGNGQEGLTTRTAKLEEAAGNAKRFGWLLLGVVLTSGVGAIIAILIT